MKRVSPYIIFSMSERSKILNRNPKMKPTDVMIEIGKRWNNLPRNEKSMYEKMASNIKLK